MFGKGNNLGAAYLLSVFLSGYIDLVKKPNRHPPPFPKQLTPLMYSSNMFLKTFCDKDSVALVLQYS